eukprot:4063437-Prymnesium_polylepis.1
MFADASYEMLGRLEATRVETNERGVPVASTMPMHTHTGWRQVERWSKKVPKANGPPDRSQ